MPFMFGFDPTFMLLIPALIFAMWAQFKVQSTYQKYARVRSSNGRTGAEIAKAIMDRNGVTDVSIEEVGGTLSDHYDPRTKKVALSSDVYRASTIAATAVAAHEVGHVLQHHEGYSPLAIRSAVAPVAQIGSFAAFPLFFIGIFFFGGHGVGTWLMDLGIWFFTGAVLFQLVTLPVEFDASRRALAQLTATGAVMPQEVDDARKVLNAAALTYVAAAAMAALQLLRLLLIRNSRNSATAAATMQYAEAAPPADLADDIECIWSLRAARTKQSTPPDGVYPDGCIELIVHLDDRFVACASAEARERQPSSFVVGPMTRPLFLVPGGGVDTVGIRFRPGAASAWFPMPLHRLADRVTPLDALWG